MDSSRSVSQWLIKPARTKPNNWLCVLARIPCSEELHFLKLHPAPLLDGAPKWQWEVTVWKKKTTMARLFAMCHQIAQSMCVFTKPAALQSLCIKEQHWCFYIHIYIRLYRSVYPPLNIFNIDIHYKGDVYKIVYKIINTTLKCVDPCYTPITLLCMCLIINLIA